MITYFVAKDAPYFCKHIHLKAHPFEPYLYSPQEYLLWIIVNLIILKMLIS